MLTRINSFLLDKMADARARVVAIYTQHNPEKLRDVDALMKEHEGGEQTLIDALVQKYGPEIADNDNNEGLPIPDAPPLLTVTASGPFRGAQVYSLMTIIKTNHDSKSMCERVLCVKPTGVCFYRRGEELRRRIAFADIAQVMVVKQKNAPSLIALRVDREHDALFRLSDDKTEELNAFQVGGTRVIANMIRNLAIRATGNTRHIPMSDFPVGTAVASLGLNLGKFKIPEGSEEFMRKVPKEAIMKPIQQTQPRRVPPPLPVAVRVPTAVNLVPPSPKEILVNASPVPPPHVVVDTVVHTVVPPVKKVIVPPYSPQPSFDLPTPAIEKIRHSHKNRKHEVWVDFDTSLLPPPTPQRQGVRMPLPLPLVLPPPPSRRDSVWSTPSAVPQRYGMSAIAGAGPAYWSCFMDEYDRLQNL